MRDGDTRDPPLQVPKMANDAINSTALLHFLFTFLTFFSPDALKLTKEFALPQDGMKAHQDNKWAAKVQDELDADFMGLGRDYIFPSTMRN